MAATSSSTGYSRHARVTAPTPTPPRARLRLSPRFTSTNLSARSKTREEQEDVDRERAALKQAGERMSAERGPRLALRGE